MSNSASQTSQVDRSSNPVRVAIIQRVIPGYRIPVFNAIADLDGVELTVIHGTNPRDRPRGNTDFDTTEVRFGRRELPTTAVQPSGLHLVWFRSLLGSVTGGEFAVYICPASPSLLQVLPVRLLTRLTDDAAVIWWGRSLGQKREVSPIGEYVRAATEYVRRQLYQSGDCCVCYSTAAAEFFQSYGVPESDTHIAYNSTDTELMDRVRAESDEELVDEICERYGADHRHLLSFVGTHTPEKNVDVLVDAHARLLAQDYDTTLVVAGSGPETDALQEYAEGVPHIHFTGRIPEEELAELLLATDVFTMPGHGGLAVQQAMTMDNPVITTPLDGTERDLVEDGQNGYPVADGDVRALASGVADVLDSSPERRREMGARSREIVETRVNIDRMVEGFRRAIEDATNTQLPTS